MRGRSPIRRASCLLLIIVAAKSPTASRAERESTLAVGGAVRPNRRHPMVLSPLIAVPCLALAADSRYNARCRADQPSTERRKPALARKLTCGSGVRRQRCPLGVLTAVQQASVDSYGDGFRNRIDCVHLLASEPNLDDASSSLTSSPRVSRPSFHISASSPIR
jgi:hypothetical protein